MKAVYATIKKFLKNYGADSLVGFVVSPVMFLVISFLCGVFFTLFTYLMELGGGGVRLLSFVLGICLPSLILVISNESDNQQMLEDLKNIFEMLKIQMHAGVYMIEALENCVETIRCKRLKTALCRLVGEIYMSKDVLLALDDFNESFCNVHVDMLVIILKQSMETGCSVQYLDSASSQMLDVEKAIYVRMENSVERNVQVILVLFMAGIIGIAVYCSIVEFKGLFEIF